MVYLYVCIWLHLAVSVRVTLSQMSTKNRPLGDCAPITSGDLGSSAELATGGLVSQNLDGAFQARVRILKFTVLCQVSGLRRQTVGSVSVLVRYQCRSGVCGSSTTETRTEQFDFECTEEGVYDVDSSRKESPISNFQTPLSDRCGACVDPQVSASPNVNPVTHCAGIANSYSNIRKGGSL